MTFGSWMSQMKLKKINKHEINTWECKHGWRIVASKSYWMYNIYVKPTERLNTVAVRSTSVENHLKFFRNIFKRVARVMCCFLFCSETKIGYPHVLVLYVSLSDARTRESRFVINVYTLYLLNEIKWNRCFVVRRIGQFFYFFHTHFLS